MRKAVYTLTDPRDGSVRYVGCTGNPRTRYNSHVSRTNTRNRKRTKWVKELRRHGLSPVLTTLYWTDDPEVETHTIQKFRAAGHPLLNIEPIEIDDEPTLEEIAQMIGDLERTLDARYARMKAGRDAE